MRALPKVDESRKRKAQEVAHAAANAKKLRTEPIVRIEDDDDDIMTPFVSLGASSKSTVHKKKTPEERKQSAIDGTAEDLIPRLTPQNVADLVLLSMVSLFSCHKTV